MTFASTCGNGIIESGEQCDDGAANGTASVCCTAVCTVQPPGTPCTGGTCDGADTCLPASTTTITSTTQTSTSSTTSTTLLGCNATPVSGCQPAAAMKAQLLLGNGKLVWKWTSSGAIATSDFGSPPTTTNYLLCLYDASGEKLSAQVPAAQTCGTKPCWKALGTVGFTYADNVGTPDGLTKVLLKVGSAGRGKIGVKGSGANLHLPALPLTTPVKVQLRQDGGSACWEATYSTATLNTGNLFKAKSD